MSQNAQQLRDDVRRQPVLNEAIAGRGSTLGNNVFVNLVVQRPVSVADIHDALEAKFGEGSVVSDIDNQGPGSLNLRILPEGN